MFVFLINGPLRSLTLDYAIDKPLLIVYGMAILHLVVAIGISYLLSVVYDRMLLPVINKLYRKVIEKK